MTPASCLLSNQSDFWYVLLCSHTRPIPALPRVLAKFSYFISFLCLFMGWLVEQLTWAKHTKARCIPGWILLIFLLELLLVLVRALQGRGLRSLCFVLWCQDICLLRLYMSRQHWEPRRKMGKCGSDALNQGGLGRCCMSWLSAGWTQYVMDLGWGWCFNSLISLGGILLLCVFDYVKYCVKLLYQDELRLPFCIQYSLRCLSRILPVSCWNPLK